MNAGRLLFGALTGECRLLAVDVWLQPGRVLCPGVEDERARAELRPGEVLELVAGPVRRIELDMEVMLSAGAARRFLMHRHHIGERLVEEAVVFLEQPLEDARE